MKCLRAPCLAVTLIGTWFCVVLHAENSNIGTYTSPKYGFEFQFFDTYRPWAKSPEEVVLIENRGNIKRVTVAAQVLVSLTPSEIAMPLAKLFHASAERILADCVYADSPDGSTGCEIRTEPHENQNGPAYLEVTYTKIDTDKRLSAHRGPIFVFDLNNASKDAQRTILKVTPYDPTDPKDLQFAKGIAAAIKFPH